MELVSIPLSDSEVEVPGSIRTLWTKRFTGTPGAHKPTGQGQRDSANHIIRIRAWTLRPWHPRPILPSSIDQLRNNNNEKQRRIGHIGNANKEVH